jgi:hypothetical protein
LLLVGPNLVGKMGPNYGSKINIFTDQSPSALHSNGVHRGHIMKKWALTVIAMFSLLIIAFTAKMWVPWLLSFTIRNKERVDSLKVFFELVSTVLAGAGAIFLPLYHLWRQKKGLAEKVAVVNVQVINRPSVSAPVSAPVFVALHQLPSPPADFTGRVKDLKELKAAILVGGCSHLRTSGPGRRRQDRPRAQTSRRSSPQLPRRADLSRSQRR